jgi:hypothetical protein
MPSAGFGDMDSEWTPEMLDSTSLNLEIMRVGVAYVVYGKQPP